MNLFDSIIAGKFGGGGGGGYNWKELGLPYSEGVKKVEILPETEATFEPEAGLAYLNLTADLSDLVAGETYTVKYNGVDYETDAVELSEEGMTALVLGNLGAMTGPGFGDAGEPFLIMRLPSEMAAASGASAYIYPLDGVVPVIVGIYGNVEIIHKLDNKYIDAEWMATYEKEFQPILEREQIGSLSGQVDMQPFVESETYKVIWQGEEYTCVAQYIGEKNGVPRIAIGDATEYGGTSNGEPFCLFTFTQMGMNFLNVDIKTGETTGTLVIKALVDVPVKIPEKFLPMYEGESEDA